MSGPLDGVRVVELGVWVAGPGAGGIMADWGADVVKIEPPEGDPCRTFLNVLGGDLPSNPVFELDNRGKRAIALDLSSERGLDLAHQLVAGADVFLTNLRPAALERIGLGPDQVHERHPGIGLRHHHRLRHGGSGRRPGCLRRRGLLVESRDRRGVTCARWPVALPARRHGRPLGSHDRCRHDQRGPRRARPHRAAVRSSRPPCCARVATPSASTSTSCSCGAGR